MYAIQFPKPQTLNPEPYSPYSLSHTHTKTLTLTAPLTLLHPLSHYISPGRLSLTHTLTLVRTLTLTLTLTLYSHCLSLSLSHCPSLTLSHTRTLSLSAGRHNRRDLRNAPAVRQHLF